MGGLLLALLACGVDGWVAPAASLATDTPVASGWREDADLHDVCFVDGSHGWAVGDRGTVWHTGDGGRTWQLQQTPVTCRLTSVSFVDSTHGWAAGGRTHPFTARSSGVVIRTEDGGQTWQTIDGLLLPAIQRMGFSSRMAGLAAGNISPLHGSGQFRTSDGGRTWSEISVPEGRFDAERLGAGRLIVGQHCAAAAFRDGVGLWVNGDGRVTFLDEQGKACHGSLPGSPLRQRYSAALVNSAVGLVSDGGRPWLSFDRGRNWQRVGVLPEGVERHFCVATMAGVGGHCWLAGAPGSVIWRSTDNARSWQACRTGARLPLHALAFADPLHGWAVGARGTILATQDGGESWQRQRGGVKRMAVLGVFARPESAPCELIATLSGVQNLRVHSLLLARPPADACDPFRAPDQQAWSDAMTSLGSTGDLLCGLPMPDPRLRLSAGQIAAAWDTDDGASRLAALTERLVASIRIWQPDRIFCDSPDSTADGAGQLLFQLVADAVELAADPAAYPGHVQAADLTPWRVGQIHVPSDRSQDTDTSAAGSRPPSLPAGTRVIDARQLATGPGRTVASLAFEAHSLLSSTAAAGTPHPLVWAPANGPRVPGVPAAVPPREIAPTNATRRQSAPMRSLSQLRLLARQRKLVDTILAAPNLATYESPAGISAVIAATKQLDAETAGNVLFQLALGRWQVGDPVAAEQLLRHLALEHRRHRLAEAAWVRLVHYHSSQEIAHWLQSASHDRIRPANAEIPSPQASSRVGGRGGEGLESQPTEASLAVPLAASVDGSSADPNPFDLMAMAERLQSERPALHADPAVSFPLAAACRQRGRTTAADAILRRQLAGPHAEPWRSLAALELATTRSLPEEGERVWPCRATDTPPHLDGLMNEPFWRSAQQIRLAPGPPADATGRRKRHQTARIMMAWDATHLYFAAACPKRPGIEYQPPVRPRPRDSDLTAGDRIELALDVNRDYATAWRFTFDHRGWTAESLGASRSWDPQYFVASHADAESWSIEVAIPFDQLVPQPPSPGDAWAVGLSRIAPGWGCESWNEPATPLSCPATFGMLWFR